MRRAGLQKRVDDDGTVHQQPGGLCQCRVSAQTYGAERRIGRNTLARGQSHLQLACSLIHRAHGAFKIKLHTQGLKRRLQGGAGLGRQQRGQRARPGVHHAHAHAGLRQVVGKFAADQAGPHDQHLPLRPARRLCAGLQSGVKSRKVIQ